MPKLSTVTQRPRNAQLVDADEFYDGITEHETRGSLDVEHPSGDLTTLKVALAVAADSPDTAYVTVRASRYVRSTRRSEEGFDMHAYVPVDLLDGLITALQGVVARARADGVLSSAAPRIA